jgi:YD repeat-containing protein
LVAFRYDADGNLTTDESTAVRGEVVELDAEGRVIARHDRGGLTWRVDSESLEDDLGELATRPKHRSN